MKLMMYHPVCKNEQQHGPKISIYDTPCNPLDNDYQKLFCPNNELSEPPRARSDKLKTGSSCQALKHAVASLHRLDDFHKEKIGSGFFSEVFKVTHRVTGQVMVLKMNLLRSNRRNMLKEVQLMNRLCHPNILSLKGVCVHEGQLHALTEYIDGGSLEQLIQDETREIPQKVRVELAKDIAQGMEYLHGNGVMHRDLTSKNVLVKHMNAGGLLRAVVGDFGLSAQIPSPDQLGKLCTVGSPYWMSPECLKGQPYDGSSDVFSYGIVLCELIARVEADPDQLPRTSNFGLDYLAFSEMCGRDVVPEFLKVAFRCCNIKPTARPTFTELIGLLSEILLDMGEKTAASPTRGQDCGDIKEGGIGSCCAAKSEEQLSLDVGLAHGTAEHRKIVHRRSLSEDISLLPISLFTSPSDKARRHALSMCRQDPHYTPRTSNPFAALPHFRGQRKLLGNFSSCFELPSPFAEASADAPKSLPGSPTASRKGAVSKGITMFAHPLFKGGSSTNLSELGHADGAVGGALRRRGSCESGFYSNVGECLSPSSLWDSGTAVSSLRSLDELEPAELQELCKRASSIYTDSSEDVSSLTSADWPPDIQPKIAHYIQYFEGKGSGLRHGGGLRPGSQLSSRIAALRKCLERQQQGSTGGGAAGAQLVPQRLKCLRLMVCEGAVRSKLPLFDKK